MGRELTFRCDNQCLFCIFIPCAVYHTVCLKCSECSINKVGENWRPLIVARPLAGSALCCTNQVPRSDCRAEPEKAAGGRARPIREQADPPGEKATQNTKPNHRKEGGKSTKASGRNMLGLCGIVSKMALRIRKWRHSLHQHSSE